MAKNKKQTEKNMIVIEGLAIIYKMPERAQKDLYEIAEALQNHGVEREAALKEIGAVCKIAQRYGERHYLGEINSESMNALKILRRVYVEELKNPNSKLSRGITREGDILWPKINRTFGEVLMERIFENYRTLPERAGFEGYVSRLIGGRRRKYIGNYTHHALSRRNIPGFNRRAKKYLSN